MSTTRLHNKVAAEQLSGSAADIDRQIDSFANRTTLDQMIEIVKMFSVLIVPIGSLLFLMTVALSSAVDNDIKTDIVKLNLRENVAISQLISCIELEQGVSSMYLSLNISKAVANTSEMDNYLIAARAKTDNALKGVHSGIRQLQLTSQGDKIINSQVSLIDRFRHKENIPELLIWIRQKTDRISGGIMITFTLQYTQRSFDALTSYLRLEEQPDFLFEVDAIPFYAALIDSLVISIHTNNILLPQGAGISPDRSTLDVIVQTMAFISLRRAITASFHGRCKISDRLLKIYQGLEGQIHVMKMLMWRYCPDCYHRYVGLMLKADGLENYLKHVNWILQQKNFTEYCTNMTAEENMVVTQIWFNNNSKHIDVLEQINSEVAAHLFAKFKILEDSSHTEFYIYSVMTAFVLIMSVILCTGFIISIRNMFAMVVVSAKKLKQSTGLLKAEKHRIEDLLNQLLPSFVAKQLEKNQVVPPQTFESVTVYFSDIVSFTTLASSIEPINVVDLLNDLYSLFDQVINKYEAYKVETIGDAYMVASGVPIPNGLKHASEIAKMALEIRQELVFLKSPHVGNRKIRIRIGLHTGSCVAGVVGTKMPRYCLFGDTVKLAEKMESTGAAMKIQITHATYVILSQCAEFNIEPRGEYTVPGKDPIKTYWLENRDSFLREDISFE